jgi:hypothetical protein
LHTALGVVGLTPEAFWRLSWKEYELTLRGFFERQEAEARRDYEVARLVSYYSVAPYMKRKKTLKEFMPFDWEKREVKLPTPEELEYMSKKFGRYTDGKGNYWN